MVVLLTHYLERQKDGQCADTNANQRFHCFLHTVGVLVKRLYKKGGCPDKEGQGAALHLSGGLV